MNVFDELVELKSKNGFLYQGDNVRAFFAPDLGARVFCELNGLALHRIDIENIRRPNKPFNKNYSIAVCFSLATTEIPEESRLARQYGFLQSLPTCTFSSITL